MMREAGSILACDLPEMSIEDAKAQGAKSLVIGAAPVGGAIPDAWISNLVHAAQSGLDIVSGMHIRLKELPGLAAAADGAGARLIDVRMPPKQLPIGTGQKRTGMRLLTVGTDCAVGKKYTALAIEREMRSRGMKADFRATGQTGILIAGGGIPIDSVVADFIAGAAECVSPSAEPDHWDVVEGQGALSHPSYAGVSLGLLHGSQPDALVLCHDAGRSTIHSVSSGKPFSLLPFQDTIRTTLEHAHRVNPAAKFVGISVNTSSLSPKDKEALFERYRNEIGLPVIDPIIDGASAIVDALQ
jgi:uncharacterized NAD-dependent epimerase/dehydratase family protein